MAKPNKKPPKAILPTKAKPKKSRKQPTRKKAGR
jgi:hypothetical protein